MTPGYRQLHLAIALVLWHVPDVLLDLTDVASCHADEPLITGPNQRVGDDQLTASEDFFFHSESYHGPRHSRLDATKTSKRAGAWCAAVNVPGEWIQVDFRKKVFVTTIATKGREGVHDQWVTSYEVKYSNDGRTWTNYTRAGLNQVFPGNQDQKSTSNHTLQTPFRARFVRLYPLAWHKHISLRWEVYGCQQSGPECTTEPLITGTKHRVLDDQLTSSSVFTHYDHGPRRSRLNALQSWSPNIAGAWCPFTNHKGHWIQVDFEGQMLVTAISTKGRQSIKQWVTSYRVFHSEDGLTWRWYAEDGMIKVLDGNQDWETEVKHRFQKAFTARYVRLYPMSWHKHISLRWEVYGCPLSGTTSATDASASTSAAAASVAAVRKPSGGGDVGMTVAVTLIGLVVTVVVVLLILIILVLWRRGLLTLNMKTWNSSIKFGNLENN